MNLHAIEQKLSRAHEQRLAPVEVLVLCCYVLIYIARLIEGKDKG